MLSKPLTLAPSLFNFFIPQEAEEERGMLGTMEAALGKNGGPWIGRSC